jgi:hypothetical protein
MAGTLPEQISTVSHLSEQRPSTWGAALPGDYHIKTVKNALPRRSKNLSIRLTFLTYSAEQ